jgi:MGT family glycosyltransferase
MRVVCASLPGPGHAFPMLAVAKALSGRGHEVVFASGRAHVDDAAVAGASFVELPSTPGSSLDALRPYQDGLGHAQAFIPVLNKIAPDVVVSDLITLGPALAAEAIGVPHATLVIHGLHLPSRELPPFGWGAAPGRLPLGRLRDQWMRNGQQKDLTKARDELNRVRAELGLQETERLDATMSTRLVLVATLPSLEIPRTDWPPHAHLVGPCLWERAGEIPALPEGDGPLVLVAASTAHEGVLLRHSLAAVARLGVRAIVTAGKTPPPAPTEAVRVVEFAPHGPLLAAADVAVCNGGHGIVARALSFGVPLVVVPGHGDQRENGYRVRRAGAGISVLKPTANKLKRALASVLRDRRFTERARRIAAEASEIDGPARAAALVEALEAGTLEPGRFPEAAAP